MNKYLNTVCDKAGTDHKSFNGHHFEMEKNRRKDNFQTSCLNFSSGLSTKLDWNKNFQETYIYLNIDPETAIRST